jgi:hypothetical protein
VNDSDLFERFALASVVASGVAAAGLGVLLFAPRTWVGRAVLAAVSVAISCGLTALLSPDHLRGVSGGGAVIAFTAVVLTTPGARRVIGRCVTALVRPRVVGAAAVLAAGGLWGFEAWRYDATIAAMMNGTLEQAAAGLPADTTPTGTAATDCGTDIPLHITVDPRSTAEAARWEGSSPALATFAGKFIRRTPATDDCNCHGWVFTGGRHTVLGRFVDTILEENEYCPVTAPEAGDLCVYRGGDGVVAHTAVVRAVLNDGTVLVEGKWGRMGVYLHDADESCYGKQFTYHRSPRPGHLLGGVGSDTTTATSQP